MRLSIGHILNQFPGHVEVPVAFLDDFSDDLRLLNIGERLGPEVDQVRDKFLLDLKAASLLQRPMMLPVEFFILDVCQRCVLSLNPMLPIAFNLIEALQHSSF